MGVPTVAGIGAAVARPEQPTLIVEGDGGILMRLPELETAARERIPIIVVVLDDRAYGAELHLLAAEGLPTRLALFDTPDLVRVAASLGCQAVRAESAEALRAALAAADGRRPLVVHVPVTRQVVHHAIVRALRP